MCLATAYKVVWPAEIEPNLKTPQSCRSEIIPHPTQSAGNRNKLLAFNVKTQQWSDLVSGAQPGAVIDWAHSPDYNYLYYTTGGPEPTTMRIRLADHKSEVIGSFKGLRLAHGPDNGTQISVAPDGSPLFTLDVGTQEIYALTVKWP